MCSDHSRQAEMAKISKKTGSLICVQHTNLRAFGKLKHWSKPHLLLSFLFLLFSETRWNVTEETSCNRAWISPASMRAASVDQKDLSQVITFLWLQVLVDLSLDCHLFLWLPVETWSLRKASLFRMTLLNLFLFLTLSNFAELLCFLFRSTEGKEVDKKAKISTPAHSQGRHQWTIMISRSVAHISYLSNSLWRDLFIHPFVPLCQ